MTETEVKDVKTPEVEPLTSRALFCVCSTWCRADPGPMTKHHPRCEHYNDSLIDVWKVTHAGSSFYLDDWDAVRAEVEAASENEMILEIAHEEMHREVFEAIPEFQGF